MDSFGQVFTLLVIAAAAAAAEAEAAKSCWTLSDIPSLPVTAVTAGLGNTCLFSHSCWQLIAETNSSTRISLGCGECKSVTGFRDFHSRESCYECNSDLCNGLVLQSGNATNGYVHYAQDNGMVKHEDFRANTEFSWILQNSNNFPIKLDFKQLAINARFDRIEIYQKSISANENNLLHRIDRLESTNSSFIAVAPVLVKFKAAAQISGSAFHFSFLSVESHPKVGGETVSGKSGSRVSHVGFGQIRYETQQQIWWAILKADNEVVTLRFTKFQLCSLGDFVTVSFQFLNAPFQRIDFTQNSVNVTNREIVSFSKVFIHFASGSGSGWVSDCLGGFQFEFSIVPSRLSLIKSSSEQWQLRAQNVPSDLQLSCNIEQCRDGKLIRALSLNKLISSQSNATAALSHLYVANEKLAQANRFHCVATSVIYNDFRSLHRLSHSPQLPKSGEIKIKNAKDWNRDEPINFEFASTGCCLESVIHKCTVHIGFDTVSTIKISSQVTTGCTGDGNGMIKTYFSATAVKSSADAKIRCNIMSDIQFVEISIPTTEEWQQQHNTFPSFVYIIIGVIVAVIIVIVAMLAMHIKCSRGVQVGRNPQEDFPGEQMQQLDLRQGGFNGNNQRDNGDNQLTLVDYDNRGFYVPGEQRQQFNSGQDVPMQQLNSEQDNYQTRDENDEPPADYGNHNFFGRRMANLRQAYYANRGYNESPSPFSPVNRSVYFAQNSPILDSADINEFTGRYYDGSTSA